MTRTPDRTFQAAARDALVARVEQQAAAPPAAAGAPARDRLRTVFATLLVGGAITAAWVVAAGMQQGRPDLPRPAGAASSATMRPAPSPSSTPAPVASSTDSTPPPSIPTTPPNSDAPTGPTLITPAGWHAVTRTELHAFAQAKQISADDPANQAIWEQETWSDIRCMAGKGFVYDPVDQWSEDSTSSSTDRIGLKSLTAAQQQAFSDALWGPPTDAAYDWQKAGCHGASVHEAGQDHAN